MIDMKRADKLKILKEELLSYESVAIAFSSGVDSTFLLKVAHDVLGDYRPGLQAIKELGIKSPLRIAGLTKQEIRELSKEMNLSTWDKPSYACLASRFVYGETIDREKLAMVGQYE